MQGPAWMGAGYFGDRPTFNTNRTFFEVYLLDQSMDLYGRNLLVSFVELIRPDQSFTSVDELIAQMKRDCDRAREILTGYKWPTCRWQDAGGRKNLVFLRRIEQPVQMHDEISHLGVVDGLARLAEPGLMGGGVVGIEADDIEMLQVLEGHPFTSLSSPPKTRWINCSSATLGFFMFSPDRS